MKRLQISPSLVICLGIVTIITLTVIGLMLPWATVDGHGQGFVNALFTAVSATDVTGLCVVDTATYYTRFGQLIILTAVQLGGLGGITIALFPFLFFGVSVPFSYRYHVKVERGFSNLGGELIDFVKVVFKTTFFCELLGAILYSAHFIPKFGLFDGIYYSVFTSVSAFCNAGFSTFTNNLDTFARDPIINWTTMGLIVLGGIGFSVIYPVIQREKLSEHAVMALKFTFFLRVGGAFIIWFAERNNPSTLGGMPPFLQYQAAQFLSITPATAGFDTIPTANWTMFTTFLLILIMFVGACPGGTGGGVKVTTVGVVGMWVWQRVCQNRKDVVFYKRKIPVDVMVNAMGVVVLYTLALTLAILVLLRTEQHIFKLGFGFVDIVFEVFSAIGTVGLSRGITPALSDVGKIVISFLMYLGRVGPATLAFSLVQNQKIQEDMVTYPDAEINVG